METDDLVFIACLNYLQIEDVSTRIRRVLIKYLYLFILEFVRTSEERGGRGRAMNEIERIGKRRLKWFGHCMQPNPWKEPPRRPLCRSLRRHGIEEDIPGLSVEGACHFGDGREVIGWTGTSGDMH